MLICSIKHIMMEIKILPTVTLNAQLGYRSSFAVQPVGGVVLGAVITNIFLNICSQLRVFNTSNNPAEVDSDFIKTGGQKQA